MTSVWNLHRWTGWLIAAILVVSLLTPTIDAFGCIADSVPEASRIGITLVAVEEGAPAEKSPVHADGDALCVHGHCHHWVGVAKLSERLLFNAALTLNEPSFGLYGMPPSALKTDLLRPPRA